MKAARIEIVTLVIPERLFVHVTEDVLRGYGNVGSVQAALQQAPEVLHSIGVDVAFHVLDSNAPDLASLVPGVGLEPTLSLRRKGF